MAASPTERTIQSRLSGTTPETSHECVLNAHHGLVNIPPACDRVNRRIVDIPNYSRGQTTERPYLNKGLLGHEPLKRFVPFWHNQAVYYHQALLDPILLSAFNNQLYSERNMAVQWGKWHDERGTFKQAHLLYKHIYLNNTRIQSSNECKHACSYLTTAGRDKARARQSTTTVYN